MLLNCSNLTFSYGGPAVLDGVSLTLGAGEVVALLGPNGSGKSTLIRCLLGQLSAGGEILWDGKPIADWRRRELARRVAYLAQALAYNPAHRVSDVLRMGRVPYLQAFGLESPRDMQVVREISQMLQLGDLIDRPLDQLSGGQRQRVFLGRCLVQEPAVLLDEPSTYLDLKHQVELGQLLRDLAKTKSLAVLMASHDLNLAGQFADRMILLDEGRIAADGPPGEVLRAELLGRVYGLPMTEIARPGGGFHVLPAVTAKVRNSGL